VETNCLPHAAETTLLTGSSRTAEIDLEHTEKRVIIYELAGKLDRDHRDNADSTVAVEHNLVTGLRVPTVGRLTQVVTV
jgi:hypothetical protein